MTQKEKQLLLNDLCGRLQYGVKVCVRFNTGNSYTANVTAISADRDYVQIRQNVLHSYTGSSVEDIRPYLRPMSSMTDEERAKIAVLSKFNGLTKSVDFAECSSIVVDYCNSRHLDYRGLVPMGLALEAPEDMYKTE